jgi:bifunctional non-homologous end joining protein LigD
MPLGQQSEPFDDPDWLYEIKHDGFRALALIDPGHCWFVSRRKHKFHGFRDLAAALVREVNAEVAVLDGELAVPDQTGRTVFAAMMKHRQQARFYAFDLLYLNGEDLRQLPLLTRKAKLRRLLPARSAHVLYVDHTKGSGQRLYELACQISKGLWRSGLTHNKEDTTHIPHWIKIKNPNYSQKEGRGDLFKRAG